MLPDLESIACFLAAARTLNFRAAAKSVHLTPAAFGKRIKQLEELLDQSLFERTTRHVSLTPNGEAMVPAAKRLIKTAQDCMRAGRGQAGPPPITITIGTRYELGLSWLMPMLPALKFECPNITINYYFGSGPDLEARIKGMDIQCAVSSRVFVDPIFEATRLVKEAYVFVAAPALLERIPFNEASHAQNHCLIDAHQERPLFRYFRDASNAPNELSFASTRIMGTTAAIRMLVLNGEGVAVLPYYLIKKDLDKGQCIQLFPKVNLDRDYFRLMYRRDDPNIEVYKTLAACIRNQPLT
jgi:LysR family transcriptional regulator, glycine cleavage system transcriptional activator